MNSEIDDNKAKTIEKFDFNDQNTETPDHTANSIESAKSCISDCLHEITINVPIDNNASTELAFLNNIDVELHNDCMPEDHFSKTNSVHTRHTTVDDIQYVDLMPKTVNQNLIIETDNLDDSKTKSGEMKEAEIFSADESSIKIRLQNSVGSDKHDTMQSLNLENEMPRNMNIHIQSEDSESSSSKFRNSMEKDLKDKFELSINQDILIKSDTQDTSLSKERLKENVDIESEIKDLEKEMNIETIESLAVVIEKNNENKDSMKNEFLQSEKVESYYEPSSEIQVNIDSDLSGLGILESSQGNEDECIYMELEDPVNKVQKVPDLPDTLPEASNDPRMESCEYMSLGNFICPKCPDPLENSGLFTDSQFKESISSSDSDDISSSSVDSNSPDDNENKIPSAKIRKSLNSLNNFSENDEKKPFQGITGNNSKSIDVFNDDLHYESGERVKNPVPKPRERKTECQQSVQPNIEIETHITQPPNRKPVPTPRKKKLDSCSVYPFDGKKMNSESDRIVNRNSDNTDANIKKKKNVFGKPKSEIKPQKHMELINSLKILFRKTNDNKNEYFPTKFYDNK